MLFKPAGPVGRSVEALSSSGKVTKKWASRLVPALLVGVALAPGCVWAQSYLVIPLAAMLCEHRASRVSVRRVADVIFPQTVSFPMKQRLNFHGAFEDVSLPSPHITDDGENFDVVVGEHDVDDILQYDGIVKENSPIFKRTGIAQIMCVLDPESDTIQSGAAEQEAPSFSPTDADVHDIIRAESVEKTSDEIQELGASSRAPPAGWRRDDFGKNGVIRRTVYAPPWSLRPPHIEPEPWLSLAKRFQTQEREKWRIRDPEGFEAQERRRVFYQRMKAQGKVARALPAPVHLNCFYNNRADCQSVDSAPSAIPSADHCACAAPVESEAGIIIGGATPNQLLKNWHMAVKAAGFVKGGAGGFNQLLIELCCADDSMLTGKVPRGCAAIRIPELLDLTSIKTYKVLKTIIRHASLLEIEVVVWNAVPCTAGCPWRHVNQKRGITTGNIKLKNSLISKCVALSMLARKTGGKFVWEWPSRCDLWKDYRVREVTGLKGGRFVDVASAAVDWHFVGTDGSKKYLRKKWRLFTTDPRVAKSFEQYSHDAHAETRDYVQCRGPVCRASACYPPLMARVFWSALRSPHPCSLTGRVAAAVGKTNVNDLAARGGHREHDSLPSAPLWCALVTRIVKPRSKEADCLEAEAAIRKELDSMTAKVVWDVNDVYSLHDLLRTPNVNEAMLGRVFQILGVKGEELGPDEQTWKARIVFQGSNIRTKSGNDAHDLFDDISNTPASFAAARAGIAVGVLRGFRGTLRDAESAYLQALMDTPARTPTFVELPREWWPDSWFHDGAKRMQPKYIRPHCRLLRALYGHPESGALWERTLQQIMREEGWHSLPEHGGVFVHAKSGAVMIVYVDDMLLLASPRDTPRIWRALEKRIKFKDPEAEMSRYLGARYRLDEVNPKRPDEPRRLQTDMDDYVHNACVRFQMEYGGRLQTVTSPFLPPEVVAEEGTPGGKFVKTCASHVATLLFLSRVARPDISVAVQRLCRVVSKWTTTHDVMLARLFSYLHSAGPMTLHAELGLQDLQQVELTLWSDADLCGDPEDTKSTSGMFLELQNLQTGARWPLSWSVKRQGATAGSTAEAETVALCSSIKHDALPMMTLLDFMLNGARRPIELTAKIDNTQALTAVHKGYSKKLRFLDRTQRTSIGAIHELIENDAIWCEYHPTSTHRGDGFTKALVPNKFIAAREMMNVRSPL